MLIPQAYHLDVGPRPYCFTSHSNKWFPFSIMIGVEDYTFLDYQDDTGVVNRICIQKGDLLAFRGDVPHGGTENIANHVHYRIHAYVDTEKLRDDQKSNSVETIPCDAIDHIPMLYDMEREKWRRMFNEFGERNDEEDDDT